MFSLNVDILYTHLLLCFVGSSTFADSSEVNIVVGIRKLLCNPSIVNITDRSSNVEHLIPVSIPDFIDGSCCSDCSYDIDRCSLLGTCCPDTMEQLPPVMESIRQRKSSCIYPQYINNKGLSQRPKHVYAAMVVRKCPYDFAINNQQEEIEIKDKCENIMSLNELQQVVPVIDIQTNITYANIHCSRCYNINNESLVYWNAFAVCQNIGDNSELNDMTERNILTKVQKSKKCDIFYNPPNEIRRLVDTCRFTKNECNITGLWEKYDPVIEKACYAYRAEFLYAEKQFENVIYHNVFCALCNVREIGGLCMTHESQIMFPSFSALLDFNAASQQDSGHDQKGVDACSQHQVFDSYKNKCRELSCRFPKVFENGECRNAVEELNGVIYRMYVKLSPDKTIPVDTFIELPVIFHLNDYIRDHLKKWNIDQYVYIFDLFYEKDDVELPIDDDQAENTTINNKDSLNVPMLPPPPYLPSGPVLYFMYHIEFHFFSRIEYLNVSAIDEIIGLDGKLDNLHISVNDFNNYNMSFRLSLEHFELCDTDSTLYDLRNNTRLYQIMPFFQTITKNRYKLETLQKLAVSLTKRATCPLIELHDMEFNISCSLNGILINDINLMIDRKYFYTNINDDKTVKYLVCSELYLSKLENMNLTQPVNNNIEDTQFSVKGILSLVCTLLSVLSCFVTFWTYARFQELRTQPGVNNMVLVLLLIAAQCIFQFGLMYIEHYNKIVCMAVGMLVHFFWLVVIIWMGICSFHMFQVFTKMNQIHSQQFSGRRSCIYLLVTISSALVFVFANVLYSSITNATNYGYSTVTCYISKPYLIGYTFALPVGVVISANIILFIAVIIQIRRNTYATVNTTASRNYSIIYTKLSTITGMTWIFGFLFSFTNNIIFEYIFIVLNASQGVYILIAFVCNKRVLNMYKRKHTGISESFSHKTDVNKIQEMNKTQITDHLSDSFQSELGISNIETTLSASATKQCDPCTHPQSHVLTESRTDPPSGQLDFTGHVL